jgi:amino acid adenylation domain-containing protein
MPEPGIHGFAMSPAQRRLWPLLGCDVEGRLRAGCVVAAGGSLTMGRLRAALARVLQRHEILRTSFHCPPGFDLPVQVIGAGAEPRLALCDLATLAAPRRQAEASRVAAWLLALPLDLAAGRPLRAALVRLAADDHQLVLALPAMAADGPAIDLLWREIAAYCTAAPAGETAVDATLQYADLAAWQNEMPAGEATREGRGHWQEQARRALTALAQAGEALAPLPAPGGPFTVRRHRLRWDDGCLARLAGAWSCVPAEAALTVWAAALWRSHPAPSMVLGLSCDGRKFAELEGAVGLLAQYLPLPAAIGEATAGAALAAEIAEGARRCRALQEHFSWELMQDLPPGSGAAAPGFLPCCFEWLPPPAGAGAAAPGFQPLRIEACTDRFSVLLRCTAEAGEAELWYDAARWPPAEIARLAGRLATLAEHAARRPDLAVAVLDLMAAAERQQLLRVGRAAAEAAPPVTLHQLVAEAARRDPRQVAVASPAGQLTYGQLTAQVDRLARRLRRHGVRPEMPVAVCLERSPDMVVALLAVLEAGGAYVPLDPSYPAERLALVLADCAAPLVLTTRRLAGLPGLAGAGGGRRRTVLALEDDDLDAPGEPAARHAGPENLAYLIYTSGSTGRPKGVMVEHRQAVHSTRARLRRYRTAADERFLLLSSYAFDSSVAGIFGTLAAGATLVLPPEELQTQPAALLRWMNEQEVTSLLALPALYSLLLDLGGAAGLGLLRNVIVAGEACPEDLVRRHLQARALVAIDNEYGPTEATVWSTVFDCRRLGARRRVPIGSPIAGARIRLFDRELRPVAWGLPGELYVGGAGVARGYLGRPDLTAERFLPDPDGEAPGERLYRTGDIARFDRDGELEFLGRADQQVKIRGFRVELAEIETLLDQHPAVEQGVVLAREDEPGNRRLVAYVVAARLAAPPGAEELRAWLLERLPEHMVPAVYVQLDSLPRLPNGKVDRAAVAAVGVPASRRFVPPRTATEEQVARMWGALLGGAAPGVDDDFFALGGHSLLAAQLTARIAQLFEVELTMRALIETPSLGGLAARVDELRASLPAPPRPPVTPVPRAGRLPLSFAQRRLWAADRLEPGNPAYNAVLALTLRGSLDESALARALDAMVERHEMLRTCFPQAEGEPYQHILAHRRHGLPALDLRGLAPERRTPQARALARSEALRIFDLESGPLLRTILLRQADDEWTLLLTMHHIVTDAWSMGIFRREIAVLYEAFTRREPPALAPLPLQYADFAAWQRSWLAGETLAEQLAFWRRYLDGATLRLDLPADHPRPEQPSHRGQRQVFDLPPPLAASLQELCRAEGVTLFMLLTAAIATLLHRHSGKTDIVIGAPFANRHVLETEEVIGFFVNALPLRTRIHGEMPFRAVVRQTRDSVLDLLAHPDLPAEQLLEDLRPDLDASSLFQVVFTLQNAPAPAVRLPGLAIEAFEVHNGTAKFDLTFNFWETPAGLSGSIEHREDLFEVPTVVRLWRHLERLLAGVAAAPETPVEQIALSTPEEDQFFGQEVGIGELESDFIL